MTLNNLTGAETSTSECHAASGPETALRNGTGHEPGYVHSDTNGSAVPHATTGIPPHVDAAPEDGPAQDEGPSSLDRAEQLADRLGAAVGVIASVVGRKLIHFAAHAKETLADCWAEAQSIRRGETDKTEPPA